MLIGVAPQNTATYSFNTVKLAVEGPIGARNAVYVRAPGVAWPDYVFKPTYNLQPLQEVARYIQANGHLPDVPSAAEVQRDGMELVAMNAALLRKVEELTLRLIALQQEHVKLQQRMIGIEAIQVPAAVNK